MEELILNEVFRIREELRFVIKEVAAQIKNLKRQSFHFAYVVGYPETDLIKDVYGLDYVCVVVPEIGLGINNSIYAKLVRPLGTLDLPPLGSSGFVFFNFGDFTNCLFFPSNILNTKDNVINKYTETLGFVDKIIPDKDFLGGKYVEKALENPSTFRILQSSNKFIFFEDYPNNELCTRVADSFDYKIRLGNNSSFQVLAEDELLDAPIGGANVVFDLGISGSFTFVSSTGSVEYTTTTGDYVLSTQTGSIDLNTISGNINITSSGGDVEISAGVMPTQKAVLGEDLIDMLNDILTAIQNITVPTAVGPSGTPLNSATFASYAAQLNTLLSSNFKHN